MTESDDIKAIVSELEAISVDVATTDHGEQHFGFDTLKLPIEPSQWMDVDGRIFHACFTILGQFVEDELGTEAWDFGESGQSSMHRGYRLHSVGDIEPKAIDLWLWYRDELPNLQDDYNKDLEASYIDDDTAMLGFRRSDHERKYEHGHIEAMEDEKLAELMAIRRGLWT